jgi:AraC-like DNA-binding protein
VTEEATRQVLPTATGFAARSAIVVLRQRNVDPAPLLRHVGLSENDFGDPQHRMSAAALSKFLEFAAETLGDSALGLHLAQRVSPREAGLTFYVASAANNVSEALTLFARYCRIVNETLRVRLTPTPEGANVEINFVSAPWNTARQLTEFGVAIIAKGLREVTGRTVSPTQVTFAHGRNANLREFKLFFGCPVAFGAPSDRFALSNETLSLPLITEDRHLLEALRPVCDEAAKERNTASGTLRASVENEVQKLLPHGKALRQTVATALAMSTRTLARKLADEGTTFEEVVDSLRRSLALQYVKERGLSLSQVAWLLGYEEPASFNHAFRRWTGLSPSLARSEQLLPTPAWPLRNGSA